jgi:prepilin-type N-terminal cleavage/methylation domain-containing protein
MKTHLPKKRGFTLVELMIAIAIMALLTGIITVNLTKSRAKGRDAKRISDIGQLQLALELYFDRCNKYPGVDDVGNSQFTIDWASTCQTQSGATITLNTFITTAPIPPTGSGEIVYKYMVPNDGSAPDSNPTDYMLGTTLESYNEVLKDDMDVGGNAFNIQIDCADDTTSTFDYCVGPQ